MGVNVEVVLMLIGAGVSIALIYFLAKYMKDTGRYKLAKRRESAEHASKKVKRAISGFSSLHRYKTLYNVVLEDKGAKATLDGLIIGYFGIIGFVACPLSCSVFVENANDDITQVVLDKKESFKNPYVFAQTAQRALTTALRVEKLYKVPVEVKVFFTAGGNALNIPRTLEPLRSVKEVKKLLHSSKFVEDKGVDLDAVEKAILKHKIG
ncbi:MAG: hypothetical protein RR058_00215 [Oscillospiraceae bacterium]